LEQGTAVTIGAYRYVSSESTVPLQTGYLITMGKLLKPGSHQVCVTPARDEDLQDKFFYYSSESQGQQDLSFVQKYPQSTRLIRGFYGLVLLVILLSWFDFWSLKPARKLFVLGSVIVVLAGIMVNLHSTAIYPLSWERRLLPSDAAVYVEGYSYKIDLGIDWMDRRSLRSSPAILYEDGTPLRHPNNSLFNIKQRGKGRVSVEDGFLYLSASDNSNPKENGRTYEIYWPTPMPRLYEYFFYLSFMIGMFFLIKFYYHHIGERDGAGLERKHPQPLILQDLT
jgi:hypothetical protein